MSDHTSQDEVNDKAAETEAATDKDATVEITMEPKSTYDIREVAEKKRRGMPLIAASLDLLDDIIKNVPEARERIANEQELLEELDRRDEYVDLERDESDYWARVIVQGLLAKNPIGEEAVSRKNSSWVQSLNHSGREIRIGQASSRHTQGNDRADIAYLQRRVGSGIELNVPLPHSGIWIRIATPSGVDYANFQFKMSEEKLNFAMTNKGFAMSSMGYRQHDLITDFALDCVTKANVKYRSPSDLKERINILDRNILHFALASVIFPNGVDFSIPCLHYGIEKEVKNEESDEGTMVVCDHVEEAKVSLRRMFFFDRGHFTNKQVEFLASGFKLKTDAELEQYREEGIFCKPKRVWLTSDIGVDIAPGSLYEYGDYSAMWLQELIDLTATSHNEPPTNARRQERMILLSNSMRAIQYRHWVQAVVIKAEDDDGEDIIYSDGDKIHDILARVISTESLADLFIQGIVDYIHENKVATIAIPEYTCPKCGADNAEDKNSRFPNLVEIEVATYFFMFVALKLQSQESIL